MANDSIPLGIYNMVTRSNSPMNSQTATTSIILDINSDTIANEDVTKLILNPLTLVIRDNKKYSLIEKRNNILIYKRSIIDTNTTEVITIDVLTKKYIYEIVTDTEPDTSDFVSEGLYNMVTRIRPGPNGEEDKITLILNEASGALLSNEIMALSKNPLIRIFYDNKFFYLTNKDEQTWVYTSEDGETNTIDQIVIDVNNKTYNYVQTIDNSADSLANLINERTNDSFVWSQVEDSVITTFETRLEDHNLIKAIYLGNNETPLAVIDHLTYIPIASNDSLGVVMGKDSVENKIQINSDGVMEVYQVNVARVTQHVDQEIILDCTSA